MTLTSDTRTGPVLAEMSRRVKARRDPLTGTPWQTCTMSVAMRDGAPTCCGCGRPVALNAAGEWLYR